MEALRPREAAEPWLIADITLAEISNLVRKKRLDLKLPLREWLETATAPPRVRRCPITPAVASEMLSLPEDFPRDPADRVIVATARVMGATLLTMDEAIIRTAAVRTLS